MKDTIGFIKAVVILVTVSFCIDGVAQTNYPTRPIQIIMPLQAGSAVDALMRPIGQRMGEILGQAMPIENVTGGAGLIGATKVAQANPDGYTLGAFNDSILDMVPNIYKKVDYDPLQSFIGISAIAGITFVMVANPNFPPNNAKEFIEYAKANPGKVDYASGGNGSPQHIGMEMFRQMSGAPLVHIPYKGAAAPVTDVIAGQVPIMISALSVVLPHIRAGRLKAIGITSAKRSPLLPNVPTIGETLTGYEFTAWAALVAPKGTSAPVISKLEETVNKVMSDVKLRDQLISQGFEMIPTGQETYNKLNTQGFNRMKKVIKDGNIRIE